MLPYQSFLRNESILIQTLTTHQTSLRDDLQVVNYESGIFSFRRSDWCCAIILNEPKLKINRKFPHKITMSTVIDKAKRRNIIISVIVSLSFFNLLKPFIKKFLCMNRHKIKRLALSLYLVLVNGRFGLLNGSYFERNCFIFKQKNEVG